ncbi:MAG: PGPGW domain-containing protein [Polyangiales bacterium]
MFRRRGTPRQSSRCLHHDTNTGWRVNRFSPILLNVMHESRTAAPKLVRVARTTAGMLLLPVGLAMLVLPGPGLAIVVGSLMLLEDEFAWAGRARTQLKTLVHRGARLLLPARAGADRDRSPASP